MDECRKQKHIKRDGELPRDLHLHTHGYVTVWVFLQAVAESVCSSLGVWCVTPRLHETLKT